MSKLIILGRAKSGPLYVLERPSEPVIGNEASDRVGEPRGEADPHRIDQGEALDPGIRDRFGDGAPVPPQPQPGRGPVLSGKDKCPSIQPESLSLGGGPRAASAAPRSSAICTTMPVYTQFITPERPMVADQSMMVGDASVFVVNDIAKSVEHYRDVLGFTVTFQYGTPTFYACLCRDEVALHLLGGGPDKAISRERGICVFVRDVDGVHAELAARGANVLKPPQNYDYGMRDFDVVDLDGNQLTFGTGSAAPT